MKLLIILISISIFNLSFAYEKTITKKIKSISDGEEIITEDGEKYNLREIRTTWLTEFPKYAEIIIKNGKVKFIILKNGEPK